MLTPVYDQEQCSDSKTAKIDSVLMTRHDLVIRNGRIIDPANNVDFKGDIVINDGIIQTVGIDLKVEAITEFNATGCLVTPGLIDCHLQIMLGSNLDEKV